MAISTTEGPERLTLEEIVDWHQGVVDALTDQKAMVLHAILGGFAVAPRFLRMTLSDLKTYYDVQRKELDRLTVLNLVASAEATIRVDYLRRIKGKLKDPLSKAYRNWHKTLPRKKKQRPDFDEGGILDVVKKQRLLSNTLIGQYRECLQTRHWVGHGRYWNKPVHTNRLDPAEVYTRCLALLQAWPR